MKSLDNDVGSMKELSQNLETVLQRHNEDSLKEYRRVLNHFEKQTQKSVDSVKNRFNRLLDEVEQDFEKTAKDIDYRSKQAIKRVAWQSRILLGANVVVMLIILWKVFL